MARPRKEGLDYFPLDVNLDYKWEAVEAVHGLEGFGVVIKLFQECYKTVNGEIDISVVIRRKTLEKKLNISEELLNNIVKTCVEVELFDKNRWNSGEIITSNGVKKRIDAVSKDRENARRRAETSSSGEKQPNKSVKTPEKVHKVKKSKVKESKEDGAALVPLSSNQVIDEVIFHLNRKGKVAYSNNARDTRKLVNAILSHGYSLEEIKGVLDLKIGQWLNDQRMKHWIRPKTLLSPQNFESYVHEFRARPKVNGLQAGRYRPAQNHFPPIEEQATVEEAKEHAANAIAMIKKMQEERKRKSA